jgi:hypothetical protein
MPDRVTSPPPEPTEANSEGRSVVAIRSTKPTEANSADQITQAIRPDRPTRGRSTGSDQCHCSTHRSDTKSVQRADQQYRPNLLNRPKSAQRIRSGVLTRPIRSTEADPMDQMIQYRLNRSEPTEVGPSRSLRWRINSTLKPTEIDSNAEPVLLIQR